MNTSLFKLLQLLTSNGPMSISEIAYYSDISEKTCQKYLNELDEMLGNVAHINKAIDKYQLVIDSYSKFISLETRSLKSELDFNDPQQREIFIISELVKQRGYVTIGDLADSLMSSRKAVNLNISNLKESLAHYHAKIVSKTSKGIKLEFANDYDLLFTMRNKVVRHISPDSYPEASEQFEQFVSEYRLPNTLRKLLADNFMTMFLCKRYQYQIETFPKAFRPLWKDDEVIEEFKFFFKEALGELTPAEELFLLSPFATVNNSEIDERKKIRAYQTNSGYFMSALTEAMVSYGIDADKAYDRIKTHLLFLLNRSLLHVEISEGLPKNIIDMYPIAMEFSMKLIQIIEKQLDVKVAEYEVNYLVLYFQMFIQQQFSPNDDKIKIAFVGQIRSSTKAFIEEKFQALIPNLVIDDYANVSQLLQAEKKYLLVLADHMFEEGKMPVIDIGTIFKTQSLSEILRISMLDQDIRQGRLRLDVLRLTAKNYFDAVEQVIDHEVALGELNDDFKKEWLKREKVSHNILTNGITIPHAVDMTGKERVLIAVGILKNKVKYKERKVKFVILIGIPQTLSQDLVETTTRVYDVVTDISSSNVLYSNLLNYDENKPIVQLTEGL